MGRRRTNRMLPLVAFAACLGFGYLVYAELSVPFEPVKFGRPDSGSASVAKPPLRPSVGAPPLRGFAETLKRPLFSESRRPAPPGTARSTVAPTALPLRLIGVIITPDRRTALIRESRSAEITELAVGQSVQGWSLERVLPDRVVMRSGEIRETYKLETETPPPEPVRPARRRAPRRLQRR